MIKPFKVTFTRSHKVSRTETSTINFSVTFVLDLTIAPMTLVK